MLDLLRLDDVPQRALLDVLDRVPHPDSLDHRRVHLADRPSRRARRRRGVGASLPSANIRRIGGLMSTTTAKARPAGNSKATAGSRKRSTPPVPHLATAERIARGK